MNPKAKKAVLVILATAPIGLAVLSFAFMVQSEMAFDESRCPYVEGEIRQLGEGVRVRDDSRVCQEGVEEHRWVVLREGEAPRTMGQRRLEASYFEGYTWRATMGAGGVRIEIRDQASGQHPRVFNEHRDGGV